MIRAALLALLAFPAVAAAQQPAGPSWHLDFDQPVTATSPADSYTHLVAIDGVLSPTPLERTCAAPVGTVAACSALLPAMTPGVHSVQVRSRRVVSGVTFDAEAVPASDTIAVNLIVVVGPTNLRVVVQP